MILLCWLFFSLRPERKFLTMAKDFRKRRTDGVVLIPQHRVTSLLKRNPGLNSRNSFFFVFFWLRW
jgi:hypothetical protein